MFFFSLTSETLNLLLSSISCYIDILSTTREPALKPVLSQLIDLYNHLADSAVLPHIDFLRKVDF